MYKCGRCGHQSTPGLPAIKLVAEKREKTYPPSPRERNPEHRPKGWEIAKELDICRHCQDELKDSTL